MKNYDIFISYASQDSNRVKTIIATLEEMGYKCWYSERDIAPGEKYALAIIRAIEKCPVFMIILSEKSVVSDNVLNELEYAHSVKKIIIPTFINHLTLPPEMNFYIRRLHWATLDETKSANLPEALGLPSLSDLQKYHENENPKYENISKEGHKENDVDNEGNKNNQKNKKAQAETKREDIKKEETADNVDAGVNSTHSSTENNSLKQKENSDVEAHPKNPDSFKRTDSNEFDNTRSIHIDEELKCTNDKTLNKNNRLKSIWHNYKTIIIVLSVVIISSILILVNINSHSKKEDYNGSTLTTTVGEPIVEEVVADVFSENIFESDKLVDLGLHVLWASQNIGAINPIEKGTMFEWDHFIQLTSIKGDAIVKSNLQKAQTQYNKPVRIPTAMEFKELINKCTWEWIEGEYNGKIVAGYKITGTNGNAIFLPAAGRKVKSIMEENKISIKISGNYWSISSRSQYAAAMLYFTNNEICLGVRNKTEGLSIRTVAEK